jgi:hypothetical protein
MFTGFNLGSALVGFGAAALLPRPRLARGAGRRRRDPAACLPFYLLAGAGIGALPGGAQIPGRAHRPHPAPRGRRRGADATPNSPSANRRSGRLAPAKALLSPLPRITLSLWGTYFMGLLVIYLLSGWLPTMIKDAGLPIERAANITALFQLGGTVGALVVGYLMDRWTPNKVIAAPTWAAPSSSCPGVRQRGVLAVRRLRAAGRLLHERRPDRPERLRPVVLPDRACAPPASAGCRAWAASAASSAPSPAACCCRWAGASAR